MSIRKNLIIPTLVVGAITIAGAWGINKASAQGGWGNNHDSIIQKLVERFNLNENDVREVFDQQMNENQQQMGKAHEERLSKLVEDGQITEEQKQAFLDKMEQNQQQRIQDREEFKNLTPQQRREKIQQKHEEMQEWAKREGIDLKVLGGFGKGFKGNCAGGCGGMRSLNR